MTHPDPQLAIAKTTRWLEQAVIGLNLCPFAKAVHIKQQIRYVVSAASSAPELLEDLKRELALLAASSADDIDTTLLIHPGVLEHFLDYNDFLGDAEQLLEELELDGVLQIASFHPDYCFADSPPEDPANFSNRSPYPTLHVLREDSVSRAVDAFADPSQIYERNVETLRALSKARLRELFSNEG